MVSTNIARKILREVKFPGDDDPTYFLAVSGKATRKAAMTQGNQTAMIAAALEVQRVWRGNKTRRKLRAILRSHFLKQRQPAQKEAKWNRFALVRAHYNDYVQWCAQEKVPSESVISFEDYCARIIQHWWRQTVLQKKAVKKWDLQRAATVIQRAWRRHNDMKLYRLYRDIISFKGKGNPVQLLRSINPSEAELMDKAAGCFVRFRLGGITFPPNIYYKIFTHRNIVDLGACSPRDYTAMSQRYQVARDGNNKDPRAVPDEGKLRWYQRWENNGWRSISIQTFGPHQDLVTTETASQKKTFHYSKLQRKADIERRRKNRKLEWLKKMYRDGAMQASETSVGEDIGGAMWSHTEDNDVDYLLSWTKELDFDDYIFKWSVCATSGILYDSSLPLEEDEFQ